MTAARLQAALSALGSKIVSAGSLASPEIRSVGWPELEALLPDAGLPRSAVVELSSPYALGGAAYISLLAIRTALSDDPRAYCAWVDPHQTLYAPGVARAGVDLRRLLVVRPPPADTLRIACKVIASGAFEIVVIEKDPIPGASAPPLPRARTRARRPRPLEVTVRQFGILASETGTTVILITDARVARPLPLPVALRLELARRPGEQGVRVAKDRRRRMHPRQVWIPFAALD